MQPIKPYDLDARFDEILSVTISERVNSLNRGSSLEDFVEAHKEIKNAYSRVGELMDYDFTSEKHKAKICEIKSARSSYFSKLDDALKGLYDNFAAKREKLESFAECQNIGVIREARKELRNAAAYFLKYSTFHKKVEEHSCTHYHDSEILDCYKAEVEISAMDDEIKKIKEIYINYDWSAEGHRLKKELLNKIVGSIFHRNTLLDRARKIKYYEGLIELEIIRDDLIDIKRRHNIKQSIEREIEHLDVLVDNAENLAFLKNTDIKLNFFDGPSFYLEEPLQKYNEKYVEFHKKVLEKLEASEREQERKKVFERKMQEDDKEFFEMQKYFREKNNDRNIVKEIPGLKKRLETLISDYKEIGAGKKKITDAEALILEMDSTLSFYNDKGGAVLEQVQRIEDRIGEAIDKKLETIRPNLVPRIKENVEIGFSLSAFLDSIETPNPNYYFLKNILLGMFDDDFNKRLNKFADELRKLKSPANERDEEYILRLRAGLERSLKSGTLNHLFTGGFIAQGSIDKAFTGIDDHLAGVLRGAA